MPEIRGITISVGYAEMLAITLPRNMRHLTGCVVVTSPEDRATQEVARSVPGVTVSITDAFTRYGAAFNKGLAMERGFDALGREGWIAIWDADCLWPDAMPFDRLREGHLHGMRRRILDDPKRWRHDLVWAACPLSHDGSAIGFFQLFHAADPALSRVPPWYDPDDPDLVGGGPWYDVSFAHAGGGDAAFLDRWPRAQVTMLAADCLHLGPKDHHWFGTSPDARERMVAFVSRNGWRRTKTYDPAAVDRFPDLVERVSVPGYPVSTYELPFVRRAKAQAAEAAYRRSSSSYLESR